MRRVCLGRPWKPCGRLIERGPRCDSCRREVQQQRDALRGTAAQRGYNGEYLANRRRVLKGGPPCYWGCGRPATTADHLVGLALGGTNALDNLVPSCKPCNYARGAAQRVARYGR